MQVFFEELNFEENCLTFSYFQLDIYYVFSVCYWKSNSIGDISEVKSSVTASFSLEIQIPWDCYAKNPHFSKNILLEIQLVFSTLNWISNL